MKREYKVGDKVRIREDLTMYETYNGICAGEGMLKYGGEIAVITKQYSIDRYDLDIDGGGHFWTPEMFDQNYKPESEKYMKTSEFKAELEKLGYMFEDNLVKNKQDVASAYISTICVNKMDTFLGTDTLGGETISDELFSLLTRYAATPIAEREDEKLFNVQIIEGRRGHASWLYRDCDDTVITSSSADNNDSDQQWTLAQIKEYGIDDETVYKRVPVEVE
ncbi:hypothetical protein [Jeotgalibaca porci]|uniref:hypothetical protein n=1 Tax=Jeotgalibaca porci TaxID=1868793 RepID=UPI0035A18E78